MTASLFQTPDVPPQPMGAYVSHKRRPYNLLGFAKILLDLDGPLPGVTRRVGPATYSEDLEDAAMVFLQLAEFETAPWLIVPRFPTPGLYARASELFVVYIGDGMYFRPLGGAGGWTTPVDNGDGTSTPRFTYVGSRVPELVH